jgi:hypothetical protein
MQRHTTCGLERPDLTPLDSRPTIRARPVYPRAPARCCCSSGRRTKDMDSGFASTLLVVGALPVPGSYLAAVTDFTEMVSPLAVPVTLASSQASLLRLSSAA